MEKKLNIGDRETYKNINGLPILRKCKNCIYWKKTEYEDEKLGYCNFSPTYFAYTLQKTANVITKEFYLCDNHTLYEENRLSQVCEKIKLKDAIKKKNEII